MRASLFLTCVAILALRAAAPGNAMADEQTSSPKLPETSKLRQGQPERQPDGSIVLTQEAARGSVRVCAKPAPECQFTDLAVAAAAAQPGSEIVLAPGIYEQGAVLAADGLTLRGEPGAHLKAHPIAGKAALVVTGAGVVIEGIECSGIEVPDENGACIRIEGDDLTVRNVNFHDNQQGILSGPGGGRVLVENSRFERNGYGGYAHGLYIGTAVEEFVFRGNVVLSTKSEGHGVKSRAHKTVIEDNVIASLEGDDSRAIDVPNGGDVLIRRNLLEKGPRSVNAQMIGLALESPIYPASRTVIEGNLIVFDTMESQLSELLSSIVDLSAKRGRVVLSNPSIEVILRQNTIVGAKELGSDVPEDANTAFPTRKAAGLPPYPEVTPTLIDRALDTQ
jgi:hypothetical protein